MRLKVVVLKTQIRCSPSYMMQRKAVLINVLPFVNEMHIICKTVQFKLRSVFMELQFVRINVVYLIGCWLLCLFYIHRSTGIECGNVNVINDLIRGGNETVKGAWPFAVVLYRVNSTVPLCGGTLISRKHVLTGTQRVRLCFTTVFNLKFCELQLHIASITNRQRQKLKPIT